MGKSYADFLGVKQYSPDNKDWLFSADRTNQDNIHFDPSERFAADIQDRDEWEAKGMHGGLTIDSEKLGLSKGSKVPLMIERNPHTGEFMYSAYSPAGDGGEYANGSSIMNIDPTKADYGKDNWEVMNLQNRAGKSLTSKIAQTLGKAILSYGFGLAAGPALGAAAEAVSPAADAISTGAALSESEAIAAIQQAGNYGYVAPGTETAGVFGSGVSTGSNLADQAIAGGIKGGVTSGGDPKGILAGSLGGVANAAGAGLAEATGLPPVASNALAQGASAALQGGNPVAAAVGSGVGGVVNQAVGGSFGSFLGSAANGLAQQAITAGDQTGQPVSQSQTGATPAANSFASFVYTPPNYSFNALPKDRDWSKGVGK